MSSSLHRPERHPLDDVFLRNDLKEQQRVESPCNILEEHTYPLLPDILARLKIPRDATTTEINRIVAWARTLVVDYEPST